MSTCQVDARPPAGNAAGVLIRPLMIRSLAANACARRYFAATGKTVSDAPAPKRVSGIFAGFNVNVAVTSKVQIVVLIALAIALPKGAAGILTDLYNSLLGKFVRLALKATGPSFPGSPRSPARALLHRAFSRVGNGVKWLLGVKMSLFLLFGFTFFALIEATTGDGIPVDSGGEALHTAE
jgi:hypothetical protein